MQQKLSLEQTILNEIPSVKNPVTGYDPTTITSLGKHLQEYIQNINREGNDPASVSVLWQKIAELPETSDVIYGKIMAEFELLEYADNPSLTDQYTRQILNADELGWQNQLYLSHQLQYLLFTNTIRPGSDTEHFQWQIYDKIYHHLFAELSNQLQWIPSAQRNHKLVIVTTSQILSEQHAPTKTALDRCLVFMQALGKEVLLINTAEQGAEIGNILLFHKLRTNYNKDLSDKDSISFQNVAIPFRQCSNAMPNIPEIMELVQLIRECKPEAVVNIGGGSLTTDLLSNIVPVLTISTVFSRLSITKSQYQAIGRYLTEEDVQILHGRGKSAEHIISGRFTFSLKKQTHSFSRSVLGIPENCFAIAVVGARLEREVTDDFLQMLLGTIDLGGFIVFVGEMDYESRQKRFPQLRENSVYLSSQSDVLAIMEQMDIYANPRRNGGGSSVVEAMVHGVVPVTLAYGDVYVNTGDSFAVENYPSMLSELRRLMTDTNYYHTKSQLAKQTSTMLTDSSTAFCEIYSEFQAREQIREQISVTVIIPCYNVEKYVARCLDSVLSQTIGYEHIQMILVDDASQDHTLQILKQYEQKYSKNILLLPLEQNAGIGAARNIALNYAIADYINFLDADDWIDPDMFRCMYQLAVQEKADFVICKMDRPAHFPVSNTSVSDNTAIKSFDSLSLNDPEKKEKELFKHRADIMCTNKLFCRSFLLKNHVRFLEGVKYEDHYFGILAWLAAKSVVIIPDVFYHWFQNPNSTCISGNSILDRITVQKALYQQCIQCGYTDSFSDFLEYNLYEKMVAETMFYARQKGMDTTALLKELMHEVCELGIDIRSNPYYIQESTGRRPSP